MNPIVQCVVFVFHLFLIATCESFNFQQCSTEVLNACEQTNQLCNEITHKCECKPGLKLDPAGKECVEAFPSELPNTQPERRPLLLEIFVSLLCVVLACAIVMIVRRYKVINWIRQKIVSRGDSGVMYEDVMIGQDDPPITA